MPPPHPSMNVASLSLPQLGLVLQPEPCLVLVFGGWDASRCAWTTRVSARCPGCLRWSDTDVACSSCGDPLPDGGQNN